MKSFYQANFGNTFIQTIEFDERTSKFQGVEQNYLKKKKEVGQQQEQNRQKLHGRKN